MLATFMLATTMLATTMLAMNMPASTIARSFLVAANLRSTYRHYVQRLPVAALLVMPFAGVFANDGGITLSGNISLEGRYFEKSNARPQLSRSNASISVAPEFYYRLGNGKDSLQFSPFLRGDENDAERSHADIRELKWHKVARDWELTLGVDTVFWGVAETLHLVNIINQVDLVENIDREDYLGQPMARLALIGNWGTLDLYALPWFRERSFPGRNGRPGSGLRVSNETAHYESGAERRHSDFALRWSKVAGAWDIGLSHFYGTSREPELDASRFEINQRGEAELIPLYNIIHQTGLDLQGTFESWLFKLEAITREDREGRIFASVAGMEYSFYNVAGSGADIGIVAEHLFDERSAVTTDNDIVVGLRLGLNDINSTELLAAWGQDLDNSSGFFFIEASRRLGDSYKLSLEARGTGGVDKRDPLALLGEDNYASLELARYF
ncbi:MAG: hypothetical protein WBN40_13740 [Pseudomonadales bacterium]